MELNRERAGLLGALAARPFAGRAALPASRAQLLRGLPIAAIVALAAALRFANLSALGYANHYYAAAVRQHAAVVAQLFLRRRRAGRLR